MALDSCHVCGACTGERGGELCPDCRRARFAAESAVKPVVVLLERILEELETIDAHLLDLLVRLPEGRQHG